MADCFFRERGCVSVFLWQWTAAIDEKLKYLSEALRRAIGQYIGNERRVFQEAVRPCGWYWPEPGRMIFSSGSAQGRNSLLMLCWYFLRRVWPTLQNLSSCRFTFVNEQKYPHAEKSQSGWKSVWTWQKVEIWGAWAIGWYRWRDIESMYKRCDGFVNPCRQ
jgi:hypothetical protein